MMRKDTRRHARVPYVGPVAISWTERGEARYARGRSINVSASGLRLELPVSVPAGTEIVLRAERINISGSARVRHVTRYGGKFLIGIELSDALRGRGDFQCLSEPSAV